MKLSEFISACGDENIGIQNLDTCVQSMSRRKTMTQLTFITDQNFNAAGTEKLGLIVWVDRSDAEKYLHPHLPGVSHE